MRRGPLGYDETAPQGGAGTAGHDDNSGVRTASNVGYYYDTGATNAVGRLVLVRNSDDAEQQIAGYDALGRITGSSQKIGGTAYFRTRTIWPMRWFPRPIRPGAR